MPEPEEHMHNPDHCLSDDLPKDLEKPEILSPDKDLPVFRAGMNYHNAFEKMEKSRGIIAEGSFATAMAFYSWLKRSVNTKHPVVDYASSRENREILTRTAGHIYIKVTGGSADMKGAPGIPWLKIFYPDNPQFLISFTDFLGMNGAWQWFLKGIRYPVVNHIFHPFYGVYFPVRHEHLVLFDHWISGNKGRFRSAVDIGTGCGLLSLIMACNGIPEIHATDINPNAVYSARKEFSDFRAESRMVAETNSLFGSATNVGGLAVFNPPWIPGKCMNMTDRGIYYETGFFENFFSQAKNVMLPDSTLAILFSTFAIEAGITLENPVEMELRDNRSFVLEQKLTGEVTQRSKLRSRNWVNRIREREKTELWILRRTVS